MSTKNTGPRKNSGGPVSKPHRLSEVVHETMTAACSECGPDTRIGYREQWAKKQPHHSAYLKKYYYCYEPVRRSVRLHKRPYSIHKGNHCERCGYIPEDLCQLDVDHRNSDHSDNSIENLWSICSNCHRWRSKLHQLGRLDKWTETHTPRFMPPQSAD